MQVKPLVDIIGMDRGAMPKDIQKRRPITFDFMGCNGKPNTVSLLPNDTCAVRACKGGWCSWEGTIFWDGRHVTGERFIKLSIWKRLWEI